MPKAKSVVARQQAGQRGTHTPFSSHTFCSVLLLLASPRHRAAPVSDEGRAHRAEHWKHEQHLLMLLGRGGRHGYELLHDRRWVCRLLTPSVFSLDSGTGGTHSNSKRRRMYGSCEAARTGLVTSTFIYVGGVYLAFIFSTPPNPCRVVAGATCCLFCVLPAAWTRAALSTTETGFSNSSH